jgi:hypothetical protein
MDDPIRHRYHDPDRKHPPRDFDPTDLDPFECPPRRYVPSGDFRDPWREVIDGRWVLGRLPSPADNPIWIRGEILEPIPGAPLAEPPVVPVWERHRIDWQQVGLKWVTNYYASEGRPWPPELVADVAALHGQPSSRERVQAENPTPVEAIPPGPKVKGPKQSASKREVIRQRILGIILDHYNRGESPPSDQEIADRVGCNRSTVYRVRIGGKGRRRPG